MFQWSELSASQRDSNASHQRFFCSEKPNDPLGKPAGFIIGQLVRELGAFAHPQRCLKSLDSGIA